MFTAKLSLFALVLLLLDALLLFLSVEGAPMQSFWDTRYQNVNKNKKKAVAYQRYVRRRPSYYPDDLYMDEYLEVFHTRRRPPTYWLSDDEIDRIIRCDFNPNLEECKQSFEPKLPPLEVAPPTRRPESVSTTRMPAITTEESKSRVATTTTTAIPIYDTTEDLPFLPDISVEDNDTIPENDPSNDRQQNEIGNENGTLDEDQPSYVEEEYNENNEGYIEENGL